MALAEPEPLALAALATLREFDVAMTPRVAAENFDVVTERGARDLLKRLEYLGYVEEVDDDLFVLSDDGLRSPY